jgi:hypothetical protein
MPKGKTKGERELQPPAERPQRRGRGRPKGSTVPITRDQQKFAVAVWWGCRACGIGPYVSGEWALAIVGDELVRFEDVESLLTAASIAVRTASLLDKHLDALVRKAKETPPADVRTGR